MDIKDLPADGVVREDGAYRIPIEDYHRQAICPGKSVSSSGLRTIELQSPADFYAFSELNPEREEKPETDALTFGRAAHALLLGDEIFEDGFAVVPEGAPPRPLKSQINARLAGGKLTSSADERFSFWDPFDEAARGKTVVREADMRTIGKMSAALAVHPLVGPLFIGEPEVSLIWQDWKTGVWLKSRPDMLPAMGDIRADLKTTNDASLRAVMRDISKRGYHMQAALADIGCEVCLDRQIATDVLVFIQKTAPYHVTPVEIKPNAIHWAKVRLRRAIDTFAACVEANVWPGYTDGVPQYDIPSWEEEMLAAEQVAGTLPRGFYAADDMPEPDPVVDAILRGEPPT
jgi:hypothetical protein